MIRKITILICAVLLTSCSSIKKLAVSQSAGLFMDGSKAIDEEAHYPFVRESLLSSIKTLEALHYSSPEDKVVLALLIKGYAGYAFGVLETEAFEDILLGKENTKKIESVRASYSKAIDYGLKYLKLYDISKEELLSKDGLNIFRNEFDGEMEKRDQIATFYFAQALAGLFNLDKRNMYLLSTTGLILGIVEKVCHKNMNFENGSCYLFKAAFEAAKPAMLGGSIDKANEMFDRYTTENPKNLLAKVSKIQFSLIPMLEEDEYALIKEKLNREFIEFKRNKNFGEYINTKRTYPRKLNLYNAIAYERFKIIKKIENKLF